jgi:hypothetical protein
VAEKVLVEKNEDYWTRKEKYEKMVENSALSWHKLYTEEKTAREAIETKYNLLVHRIRQEGKKKVDDGDAFLRSYWRKME